MDMDFKPKPQNTDDNNFRSPAQPPQQPDEPVGAPPVTDGPDLGDQPAVAPSPETQDMSEPTPAPEDGDYTDTPAPDNTAAATKPFPAEQHALPAHASSNKPIGAIVTAIVVALILAGLTVFAFIKTSNTIEPISEDTGASTQPAATPADVDKTIEDIDKTMNSVDDTQDINNQDLSDPSLGL